nr:hypothetical protein [Escherichia coli]
MSRPTRNHASFNVVVRFPADIATLQITTCTPGGLIHGEAVAAGMVMAARTSN